MNNYLRKLDSAKEPGKYSGTDPFAEAVKEILANSPGLQEEPKGNRVTKAFLKKYGAPA